MSTGSWLRTHRKQIITHTLIVGGFLFFLFFLAGVLFDRPEVISGESRLYDFPLPGETRNVRNCIDAFVTDGSTVVEVTGWAFIEGMDQEDDNVYIVFKSTSRTYIFDTEIMIREVDYSKFTSLIPMREIADGKYTVGIYIRKGDIEALQYTNKAVIKSTGTVKLTE